MIDMDRKAEHHIPYFDEDLFSAKALRDPFPFYHAIRDMGPVVRLRRPDVYAIGRFADVQKALRSPDILVSGQGVAFNDLTNAPSPQPATISSDGERHRKLRSVLSKPLMPAALKEHRERLSALITARIEELIDQPEFDAVTGIAQHLPVQAISYLVGLPEEGRSRMLDWASAVFNTSGPLATDGEEEEPDILTDLALRDDALRYLLSVDAQHLRPGSWSDALFQAVHAGKLELGEARAALSGLVVPSLDTTILSKANLLYNLGLNRHYWDMLRANPKLIPSAVLEGVRYSAVVRWFSRVAVRDYEVGGFTIPAGSRVSSFTGRPIAMNGNMAMPIASTSPAIPSTNSAGERDHICAQACTLRAWRWKSCWKQ